MSIAEPHDAHRPSRTTRDWTRWSLLAIWVALVLTAVMFGERQGRFSDLQNALAQGQVTQVTVRGEALPEDSSGYITQTVVWSGRWWITRQDEVRMTAGEEDDGSSFAGPALIGEADLGTYLQRTYPGVKVDRQSDISSESSLFGFHHLPVWTGLVSLVLALIVLVRIIIDPDPWRMTRWGWFWAWLLVGSMAIPAFLLLSGPTPFVPTPKDNNRRISGGWAFLLCLFLSRALPATWAARSW